MSETYTVSGNQWVNAQGAISGGGGGGGGGGWPGGLYTPARTIWGLECTVPKAENTDSGLNIYKAAGSQQAMLDIVQNEYAGLIGFTPTVAKPLVQAFRGYDPGWSNTFSDNIGSAAASRGMIAVCSVKTDWASMAAGSWNSQIATFVHSCPTNRPTYYVWDHEPDNDSGFVGGQWKAGAAKFCQQVLLSRGTTYPVIPTLCVTNWALQTQNTGANFASCDPSSQMDALSPAVDWRNEVLYTTDPYIGSGATGSTTLGASAKLLNTGGAGGLKYSVGLIRSWGFARVGTLEGYFKSYGTADRNNYPAVVRELADLAITLKLEIMLFFMSGVGGNAYKEPANEGWWIYGTAPRTQVAKIFANQYPA